MKNYHELMERVLREGVRRPNRTGVDTLMVPAATLSFDLREGFPAITTKKLAFGACKGELLGFFRGYSNAARFRELNCRVWDANANETSSWLASRHRAGTDDLGRIYGVQWTGWQDLRVVPADEAARLREEGFEEVAFDAGRGVYAMRRTLNQLETALRKCRFEPNDRRIIVSAWRPDEFDRMALPPCHVLAQFLPNPVDGTLHLTMYQRSCDVFLGIPFNIASYALFCSVMARLAGLTPATLTMFLGDVHIYVNHLDQVREQLTRQPYPAPTLVLSSRVRRVESVEEVAGAFARIEPEDLQLDNYRSWPALKAPMAA
jgi:thymidylate synthase